MVTIYRAYTRRVEFEGTAAECWKWICARCFRMETGELIYQSYKEDGEYFYDTEAGVFCTNCELYDAAQVEKALSLNDFDLYDNDESDGHLYN